MARPPRDGPPHSPPDHGATDKPPRPGFEALGPFFEIIAEGLGGLVDGEDFFDTLAEDAVFEYVISVPGYPRHVVGREAVVEHLLCRHLEETPCLGFGFAPGALAWYPFFGFADGQFHPAAG